MGAVYEAEDTETGAIVAVKVLAAHMGDDAALRRRFDTEIETLKSLRHPAIVRLLAFGEEDGQPYFAMELVHGRSLEELIRGGRRFTWRETVATAGVIAGALKAAHDHGVVHRDLKPANLLFVEDAAPGRVTIKLADFGIARLFGDAGQTQAGTVVGTVEYMAPEQASGQPIDHRADLYALGLVMFAMLAGRPPFQGSQPLQVLEKQKREVPPRVSTVAHDVPGELDELIARLLAKDPAARPASALALGRLLNAVVEVHDAPPPTAVDAPAATTPADVDLLAVTRPGTAAARPPVAAAGTERMAPPDAATMPLELESAASPAGRSGLARQPTTPETGGRAQAPIRRTHHTTVEEERRVREAWEARAQRWELGLRIAGALGIAVLVAVGVWFTLRRPDAEALHAAILKTIAANPERLDGLKDAYPSFEQFLEWYPDDPRADVIRDLRQEVDVDRLRMRIDLRARRSATPRLRVEHAYRDAMALRTADPVAAFRALAAILQMPADALARPVSHEAEDDELALQPDLWQALVRQQMERLRQLDKAERRALQQDAESGR